MTARLSTNGKRIGRPPKAILAPTGPALAVERLAEKILNRYDAAGMGRRMAAWNPASTGPNRAMEGLQRIRNRSRDASRNDWAGESTVQKWATALIGIAITPRFKNVIDKDRKKAITQLWGDFVAQADADCVLDVYGMQTLAVRSWFESGEVFVRRRARFLDAGYPVPMQIQLLEADMCPLLDTDSYQGLPVGNIIRSGIELNNRGTRVAYWFFKQHPGERFNGFSTIDPASLVRVAASDICHVFEPKRPGQLRGVSILAPILAKLRNIGDYEDAVLERQKVANLFVGFITKALPTLDPNDPSLGALGRALEQVVNHLGETSDDLAPMGPGLLQELEDGQKVEFSNPPEAGTTYSDYMRTSHLGSAAASGLPYELYSGDILNISDRTLRVLINDFRRLAQQRQWQIVIPMMCQPIVSWFVDAAVLAGLIQLDEIDSVKRCTHAPHGWEYIHPVQDVQGKALAELNGFTSRSQIVGERGDDIEEIDAERAADQQREIDLGLAPDPNQMPDPNIPAGPPAPAPAPAKKSASQLDQIEAGMEELRQLVAAGATSQHLAEVRALLGERIVALNGDGE